ncbi:MAG: hypothetical protein ACJAY8_000505 [Sphingobacteriales bacterium]|jgi:hypothetical protein
MVITLEQRNAWVAEKNELKAKLDGEDVPFMEKLEIKDRILELEKNMGEAKLWDGEVDECENCSG